MTNNLKWNQATITEFTLDQIAIEMIEYTPADRASYSGYTPGMVVEKLGVEDLTDAERLVFGFPTQGY